MRIFKLIEIDLEKERARINKVRLNKKQKKVLFDLINLFEQGKWQKCLDFVNNKNNFPYNKKGEYSELEHIGIEIADVLQDLVGNNYYTIEQFYE